MGLRVFGYIEHGPWHNFKRTPLKFGVSGEQTIGFLANLFLLSLIHSFKLRVNEVKPIFQDRLKKKKIEVIYKMQYMHVIRI